MHKEGLYMAPCCTNHFTNTYFTNQFTNTKHTLTVNVPQMGVFFKENYRIMLNKIKSLQKKNACSLLIMH